MLKPITLTFMCLVIPSQSRWRKRVLFMFEKYRISSIVIKLLQSEEGLMSLPNPLNSNIIFLGNTLYRGEFISTSYLIFLEVPRF